MVLREGSGGIYTQGGLSRERHASQDTRELNAGVAGLGHTWKEGRVGEWALSVQSDCDNQADGLSLALGSNGLYHLRAAGWDGTGHSEKVSPCQPPPQSPHFCPPLLFSSLP